MGGASLFWLAPAIPLLALIPEGLQHIAEIRLGMFESERAFRAHAFSPERMVFGVVKVIGLMLAILAAARFLGGAGKDWWRPSGIVWRAFWLALALNIVVSVSLVGAGMIIEDRLASILNTIATIATLPLLVMLIAPLLGDATMGLRRAFTAGWIHAIAMVLLAMIFLPAQMLHEHFHTLAIGSSQQMVWLLMALDTLLVGLMGCLLGGALAGGYTFGNRVTRAKST